MKKAFITGVSGFAGSYLADYLLEQGNFEVSGTYLSDESAEKLKNKSSIDLHKVNLLDKDVTHEVISKVKPDFLFHLAAVTSPKESFDNPIETFTNNIASQINILESLKKNEFIDTKVLVVSSSEVYGLVEKEDLPIDEDTPLNPTNPYAVSKIAQDFSGLQYFLTHNLKVIRVRPFNHVGPGQSPNFVVASFAKKITDIEKGKENVVKVGNLTAKRDFSDVRDIVRAYLLALEKGEPGDVYNLGSGKSQSISEILEMMIGMSHVDIKTEQDQSLLRPFDDPELVCDYSKFNKLTGWEPEIPIEKTLEDTLEYWRGQN
jgi:GDP-4-dehydro-6-deoxy-D-mannose reductase